MHEMPTPLIINADDYGYTPGVSLGIRQAVRDGVVSSVTAMMNTAYIDDDLSMIHDELPDLPIGVHLVATAGRPLSSTRDVSSLVTGDGSFLPLSLFKESRDIKPGELRGEWARQIEKLAAASGSVDHLDSHHHAAYANPRCAEVLLDVAREYDLPVRRPAQPPETDPDVYALFESPPVPVPDVFVGDLINGSSVERLRDIIVRLPRGRIAEVMVHPGVVDDLLRSISAYSTPRAAELETLLTPGLSGWIADRGFRLCTFAALAKR